MKNFVDDTGVNDGTPINRANLMASQGFQSNEVEVTTVNGLKTIIETNSDNDTLVTTFNADGTYTQVFTAGTKVITKNISFSAGSIVEEVEDNV